jgi:hypothetical protein
MCLLFQVVVVVLTCMVITLKEQLVYGDGNQEQAA